MRTNKQDRNWTPYNMDSEQVSRVAKKTPKRQLELRKRAPCAVIKFDNGSVREILLPKGMEVPQLPEIAEKEAA